MQQERFTLLRSSRPTSARTLLIAAAPLALAVLLASRFDGVWLLVLASLVWLVAIIAGTMLFSRMYETPYELRVDDAGIEFGADGSTTRIPWKQVERVSVVRTPTRNGPTSHLVAWLEPGSVTPVPPDDDAPEPPYYDRAIGGVRICDMNVWDATPAEIQWVLAKYAGQAWKKAS